MPEVLAEALWIPPCFLSDMPSGEAEGHVPEGQMCAKISNSVLLNFQIIKQKTQDRYVINVGPT